MAYSYAHTHTHVQMYNFQMLTRSFDFTCPIEQTKRKNERTRVSGEKWSKTESEKSQTNYAKIWMSNFFFFWKKNRSFAPPYFIRDERKKKKIEKSFKSREREKKKSTEKLQNISTIDSIFKAQLDFWCLGRTTKKL